MPGAARPQLDLESRFPGAWQSEIGYFSTVNIYEKYLDPKLAKQVYGDVGRDGGSLEDRARRVYVWNTRPNNLECDTEKGANS